MTAKYDFARASAVGKFKRRLKASSSAICMICGWNPPYFIAHDAWKILHIHHIVPVRCGGTHESSNLVALCPNCHAAAHFAGTRHKNKWYGARTISELREHLTEAYWTNAASKMAALAEASVP